MNYAGLEKRAHEIIGYAKQNGQDVLQMTDCEWLKYRKVGTTTLNFIKQVIEKMRRDDCAKRGNGKTLRDEFAMAALTGMCAHTYNGGEHPEDAIASWAYYQADAMLKAREAVK